MKGSSFLKHLPEQVEELIVGYVLGNLTPEEAEKFRPLLAKNPQLATQVSLWQEALELLPYALPEVEPPPHLRSAILSAACANSNHRGSRE